MEQMYQRILIQATSMVIKEEKGLSKWSHSKFSNMVSEICIYFCDHLFQAFITMRIPNKPKVRYTVSMIYKIIISLSIRNLRNTEYIVVYSYHSLHRMTVFPNVKISLPQALKKQKL